MILKYTICDVVESTCYGLYDSEEAAEAALQEWLSADDSRSIDDYDVCKVMEKLPD